MKIELREYQRKLIGDARSALRGARRVLCVSPCGSGKTVVFADMCARHLEKRPDGYVWFLVHRRELVDQTKATFDRLGIPTDRVLIGMVATVANHMESTPKPTMIVFDEAHHATARTWSRITEANPDTPVIGLTATPCRLDGKPLSDAFDALVLGPTARDLAEAGHLCRFDYYAPRINLETAQWRIKGSDYDAVEAGKVMDERKVYGDVLKYADPKRKTIVYCPSIAFSEEMEARLNAVWPSTAKHFDGSTPKAERDAIIRAFRDGSIRFLCNVDLIGEGFDVPDCDCAMLLRPTMSTALYIQQSMRPLRPRDGKRAVIYDFVGNAFRHGLPDADREWSLSKAVKPKRDGDRGDEVIVRECKRCFRVYKGNARTCPYCGADNGKPKPVIEEEARAELERIEALERKRERMEVGMARSFAELVGIGKARGYKNPAYWANQIMKGRKYKI